MSDENDGVMNDGLVWYALRKLSKDELHTALTMIVTELYFDTDVERADGWNFEKVWDVDTVEKVANHIPPSVQEALVAATDPDQEFYT